MSVEVPTQEAFNKVVSEVVSLIVRVEALEKTLTILPQPVKDALTIIVSYLQQNK